MSLKNGDLVGTVLPEVSIDEFEPKAGNVEDVIVVAFYLQDEEPAEDLNTFIQRGFIDTLDVEVSPSTDEEGRYLVFVEMSRNETFPEKFLALLQDVENCTKEMDWKIRTYYSGDTEFSPEDPELLNYLILTPEEYVPRAEFKMKEIEEGINDFFSNSLATNLTIDGNIVTLSQNRTKIVTEVVDVGDYDVVIGRNFLTETAFGVGQNPYEAKILQSLLMDCQILPLGKYLCASRGEKIALLKNTQLI